MRGQGSVNSEERNAPASIIYYFLFHVCIHQAHLLYYKHDSAMNKLGMGTPRDEH